MWRFTKAAPAAVTLVGVLLSGSAALAADCSYERQENLLTTVFYREAEPAREAHASVMSIILTALKNGKRGNTLCAVMTYPGFVVHTLKGVKRIEAAKMAVSRANARLFLSEYHTQGAVTTEAHVFDRLKDLDSFHAKSFRGAYASSCKVVIGDNCFYKYGTTSRHGRSKAHGHKRP